ncbi:MAG TPA: D-glycero-beta-D-manno-heptose 1-phosphate adenylyltransferase [Pirellulales bacterium]|nr:D-glycero-beta-D-manno-heptose 1-phosphate adenylyltransferase [Pirellulales bacterium]
MNPQILIVGDVMLDRYTWGRAERVSPEAPVLVLDVEREDARLGGAGAVAALLAGLDAQPVLAGVVGDDPAGRAVTRLVAELGHRKQGTGNEVGWDQRACERRPTGGDRFHGGPALASSLVPPYTRGALLPASDRPTTVKERLIGAAAGKHGQAMLRVDRESRRPLPREVEDQLRAAALETLRYVRAVLISDYGKGVCTPRLLSAVIRAARRVRVPVLVDPRRGGDYALYRWATLIKPNRREASEATGREIRCVAEAFAAGKDLCARWGFGAAVITLDADGMVLVTADGEEKHICGRQREICDVTGAGDTVLAVLGRSLAEDRPLAAACELANAAAALQVERLGVARLSWREIRASVGNALCGVPQRPSELSEGNGPGAEGEIANCKLRIANLKLPAESPASVAPASNRQFAVRNLQFAISLYRAAGRKIVFTNGCFDLLHPGHLHCLSAAKALGDVLIVGVNSDASVRRLKGPSRPIVGQRDRAAMLAALDCVDHVVIFDDDTPERLIADLRPDVLVKGAEERPDGVPGADLVQSYGGEVALVPLLADLSTTAIVKRWQGQASSRIDSRLNDLAACIS